MKARPVREWPDGRAQGPRLEPLGKGEEKDDARAFEPLPEDHRSDHGDDHQDVDVDRARAKGHKRAPRGKNAARDGGGNEKRDGQRRAPAVDRQSCQNRRTRRHGQPEPDADIRAGRARTLVFQPHPHPGLPDGVDNSGRSQLCGVI